MHRWTEEEKFHALKIFKELESYNFKKGKQAELCREYLHKTDLREGELNGMVSAYKGAAGINPSTPSPSIVDFFNKYKDLTISEIEVIIEEL